MVPVDPFFTEIFGILALSLTLGLFFSQTIVELVGHLREERTLASRNRRRVITR